MCAQTQHAFKPVYMSISVYESVHCVLRQMQLTVLSINTIFSSMLHDGGKVIFCSRRGGHFAEHRGGGGGGGGGDGGGGGPEEKRGVPCLCESTSTGFSRMK